MRANCVGTTITGRISMSAYILEKYDGLVPDNYPTKSEYLETSAKLRDNPRFSAEHEEAQRRKNRMDRIIKGFRKEWVRQQRGN